MSDPQDTTRELPLHALHVELGAKLVPFAGYSMPLNYPEGILKEHRWCRSSAALFDVSHMGQIVVRGSEAAAALESLTPADLIGLPQGRARYCLLTNAAGGILDDLIVTRLEQGLHVVVNASRRQADLDYLRATIGARCEVDERPQLCLLALQGPAAAAVMERLGGTLAGWRFMSARPMSIAGIDCTVDALGLHRRRRLRAFGRVERGDRARPPAAAPARSAPRGARRPRFAAPRGRPVPPRTRHRRDDDSRSRPISRGRSVPRAAPAAPGPGVIPAPT